MLNLGDIFPNTIGSNEGSGLIGQSAASLSLTET